ncbi:MAG: hypothetical protein WKF45_09570, partial [Ilumatobacteraceae bacterium]
WDVTFVPFSLGQAHVEEGQSDIWTRPADDSGLLALQLGIAVRDTQPQHFLDVHAGLFALRHDSGGDLRDRARLHEVLAATDVDADAAWEEVDAGRALATIEKEHVGSVEELQAWGVPTFSIEGGRRSFACSTAPPMTQTPSPPWSAWSTRSAGTAQQFNVDPR